MTNFSFERRETLLKLTNVSLQLGGKQILRDINLEIKNIVRPGMEQGQVIALLGPSGIGKTQLFRMIAGLQKPTTGEILVDVAQEPVRAGRVGVVAQNYPLFDHLTVYENMLLAAHRAGLKGQAAKDKIAEVLTTFRIEDHAEKYPCQLSGGQKQRVAIAQQLIIPNHLLLMDEPVSGLDTTMVDRVCKTISDVALVDELNTIVVVTHDISAAVRMADTVYLLGRDEGIAGATIKYQIDLIERGLAWRPDITQIPAYAIIQREIREIFPNL